MCYFEKLLISDERPPLNPDNFFAEDKTSYPNNKKAWFKIYNLNAWHQYQIDFYNTRTGAWVATNFESTNINGTLKVWVPKMTKVHNPDLAYKVYDESWKSQQTSANDIDIQKYEDVYKDSSTISDGYMKGKIKFNLYPNPTNDGRSVLRISSSKPLNNATLVVFNLLNEEVLRKPIQGNQCIIDLNGLSNGLYMVLVIQNGNIIYSSKLIHE